MLNLVIEINELRKELERARLELSRLDTAIEAIERIVHARKIPRNGWSLSKGTRSRVFSAAGRRRISIAQKRRWAKYRKKLNALRH